LYALAFRARSSHPANHYPIPTTQTNARLGAHVGFDAWNVTSASGGTIQAALDFAMTIPPGDEEPTELYPSIGAGAAVFGDRDLASGATYSSFLANVQQDYPADPWFFWDQPLSDLGWVSTHAGGSGAATPSGTSPGPSASSSANKNGGARILLGSAGRMFLGAVILVLLHILLFV